MSGPVVPPGGEDELRSAIRGALHSVGYRGTDSAVAAVHAVVLADREQHARERAAEELEAAAAIHWADRVRWAEVRLDLRSRADALTREAPARPADPVASLQDFLR